MSAHVAGRELDALVAEKVVGDVAWDIVIDGCSRDGGRHPTREAAEAARERLRKRYLVGAIVLHDSVPEYSTDIAAAWQICETAERERCFVSLSLDPDGVWWARVGATASQSAPTAPLALCRAALAYADLCAGLPPLWSEAP